MSCQTPMGNSTPHETDDGWCCITAILDSN